jgi:hypothetical protein
MFVRPPRYILKTRSDGQEKVRLSYISLANILGGPFAEDLGQRKLRIEQVTDEAIREATRAWVAFQQDYAKSPEVEKLQTTLQEYEQLAEGGKPPKKEEAPREPPSPTRLTPLSFPVTKKEDPWFPKVLASVDETVSLAGKDKTLALLHVEGWSAGDTELFDDLAAEMPASIGIEIWIDGHSDYEGSQNLADYIALIKALSKKHRTVVLAYSSLLGAFLAPAGVGAFASGMGTSEEKTSTSEPATGGGYARYYVPLSSKPERIADCRLFFTEHPDQFCRKEACASLLGRTPQTRKDFDSFFEQFFMPESKTHFLEVRAEELQEISTQTNTAAAQALRERLASAVALNYDNYFRRMPRHLDAWAATIEVL